MKKQSGSPWTSFLKKDYVDEFDSYKDSIAYKLEVVITEVKNDYKKHYPNFTDEELKQVAMTLVMEKMLHLSYEHAPKKLEAMTVALFSDLPGLADTRQEIFEKILDHANEQYKNESNWFEKIKSMIGINKNPVKKKM